MRQTTLSPKLVVYVLKTKQGPENNLTPRLEIYLIRTGTLDCPGKPLVQKLEQITLIDIEIDILLKFFYFVTTFDYKMSRLQDFGINSIGQSQLYELEPQLGERKQIQLNVQ